MDFLNESYCFLSLRITYNLIFYKWILIGIFFFICIVFLLCFLFLFVFFLNRLLFLKLLATLLCLNMHLIYKFLKILWIWTFLNKLIEIWKWICILWHLLRLNGRLISNILLLLLGRKWIILGINRRLLYVLRMLAYSLYLLLNHTIALIHACDIRLVS
jgi:hypothetical protein